MLTLGDFEAMWLIGVVISVLIAVPVALVLMWMTTAVSVRREKAVIREARPVLTGVTESNHHGV